MSAVTDADLLALLDDPELYALATQSQSEVSQTAVLSPGTKPDGLSTGQITQAKRLRRERIARINTALSRWTPTLDLPTETQNHHHQSLKAQNKDPPYPQYRNVSSEPIKDGSSKSVPTDKPIEKNGKKTTSDESETLRKPRTKMELVSPFFAKLQKIAKTEDFSVEEQNLDPYQKQAIEAADEGRSFFLTGSAGTGKSYVLKHIIRRLRAQGKQVAVTASTGCAAVALQGGTIHSVSGVGLGIDSMVALRRKGLTNRRLRRRLQVLDTLVIDEISMIESFLFDKIEAIIRAARDPKGTKTPRIPTFSGRQRNQANFLTSNTPFRDEPFGGLQVIVCGDFYQLPPVGKKNARLQEKFFAFEAEAWKHIIKETFVLRLVHRQGDTKFVGLLNEVRQGVVSEQTKQVIQACMIGNEVCIEADESGNRVHYTKLFAYLNQVNAENGNQLRKLKSPSIEYISEDLILRDQLDMAESAVRNMLENGQTSVSRLSLKQGSRVLCIKNIAVEHGICNGAGGVVVGYCLPLSKLLKTRNLRDPEYIANYSVPNYVLTSEIMDLSHPAIQEAIAGIGNRRSSGLLARSSCQVLPVVKFDNGIQLGMVPEMWEILGLRGQVIASRTQVPLILGWALSIHKSQGMTLEDVETDLGHAFDFGQVYVALSRAKTVQRLRLRSFDARRVKSHEKVNRFYEETEVVCSEVKEEAKTEPVVNDEDDKMLYKEESSLGVKQELKLEDGGIGKKRFAREWQAMGNRKRSKTKNLV